MRKEEIKEIIMIEWNNGTTPVEIGQLINKYSIVKIEENEIEQVIRDYYLSINKIIKKVIVNIEPSRQIPIHPQGFMDWNASILFSQLALIRNNKNKNIII